MGKKKRNKIKVSRIDKEGEFCEKYFKQFCKECGVAQYKTTPYTPQHNGFVEKMNKSLMQKRGVCSVDRKSVV